MAKREQKKALEDKITQIEERIRAEEAKMSRVQSHHSSHSAGFGNIRKIHAEENTASSNNKENEDSKSCLINRKIHKQELSKEDNCENSNSEHKDNCDNEMGFRITATSMFKNNLNHSIKQEDEGEETESETESPMNVDSMHQKGSYRGLKMQRSKSSNLHVIEDVSESKEMSQNGFQSFKSKSPFDKNPKLCKKFTGRKDHNNSELIKS